MTKVNHKQVLKDALDWIKQTYLSNPNELRSLHGICKAVAYYCHHLIVLNADDEYAVYEKLLSLIKRWPHCRTYDSIDETGQLLRNTTFPVSTGDQWDYERDNGTIWNNLKRLELLEYLIQEVNKHE